jgi:pantoate--beta-alanine ligase
LCGQFRPGHFQGVTTVVTKLFFACKPDRAFFGEKDYQQFVLIRRMAKDLDTGIEIVGCPTIREDDGIAMSSRNVNLQGEERERSLSLSRGLFKAKKLFDTGEVNANTLVQAAKNELEKVAASVDYVQVVDSNSLTPVEKVTGACRMLIAAKIGKTRLIDNIPLRS